MTLRDRLAEAFGVAVDDVTVDIAVDYLTEGIVIVTPHRENGCWENWVSLGKNHGDITRLRCLSFPSCPAEARIPEALLVELVEAAEAAK